MRRPVLSCRWGSNEASEREPFLEIIARKRRGDAGIAVAQAHWGESIRRGRREEGTNRRNLSADVQDVQDEEISGLIKQFSILFVFNLRQSFSSADRFLQLFV
jgi:hypothetical protein